MKGFDINLWLILLIPLLGTTLGAACVYFLKDEIPAKVQKALLGFAAGVMIAASVWSLLIPAIEMTEGRFAWFPAATGFLLGIAFLLFLDSYIPHLHLGADEPEGKKAKLKKNTMLIFAVTLHNFPEGMAVGVVIAGVLAKSVGMSLAGAFSLAIGIALQNFPEGAVVSMPLIEGGTSKNKAFLYGFISGVVEPMGALLTIFDRTYDSFNALCAFICGGSDDLGSGGRVDTGITTWKAFKYRNGSCGNRICTYDGFRCSFGVEYVK